MLRLAVPYTSNLTVERERVEVLEGLLVPEHKCSVKVERAGAKA